MRELTREIIANLAADLSPRPHAEVEQLLTVVLFGLMDIEQMTEEEMREHFDAWAPEETPRPLTKAELWAEYGDWLYHVRKDEGMR
jgi:hypothetical protein